METSLQWKVFKAKVTHVIDPSNFYLQMGTVESFRQFEALEDHIQKYAEEKVVNNNNNNANVQVMQSVLAYSSLHKKWYRALVVRIFHERGADVYHLDYGTMEMVCINHVCSDTPPEFWKMPNQAMKCNLFGIKPIAKTWISRATKCFEHFANTEDLVVMLMPSDMVGVYNVAVYNMECQRSVTDLLLEEEVGMQTDEPVPDFQAVLPLAMLLNTNVQAQDCATWQDKDSIPVSGEIINTDVAHSPTEAKQMVNMEYESDMALDICEDPGQQQELCHQTLVKNSKSCGHTRANKKKNLKKAVTSSVKASSTTDQNRAKNFLSCDEEKCLNYERSRQPKEEVGSSPSADSHGKVQRIPSYDLSRIEKTKDLTPELMVSLQLEGRQKAALEEQQLIFSTDGSSTSYPAVIPSYSMSDLMLLKGNCSGNVGKATDAIDDVTAQLNEVRRDMQHERINHCAMTDEEDETWKEENSGNFDIKSENISNSQQLTQISKMSAVKLTSSKSGCKSLGNDKAVLNRKINSQSPCDGCLAKNAGTRPHSDKDCTHTESKIQNEEPSLDRSKDFCRPDIKTVPSDVKKSVHAVEQDDLVMGGRKENVQLKLNFSQKLDLILNQATLSSDWSKVIKALGNLFSSDNIQERSKLSILLDIVMERAIRHQDEFLEGAMKILTHFHGKKYFIMHVDYLIGQLQRKFVKISEERTSGFYHCQYAVLIGSIFNHLLLWKDRNFNIIMKSIKKIIVKWIVFNKVQRETPETIRQQQIFLECFAEYWKVAGASSMKMLPQDDVKFLTEEILNGIVSEAWDKNIRKQMLLSYLDQMNLVFADNRKGYMSRAEFMSKATQTDLEKVGDYSPRDVHLQQEDMTQVAEEKQDPRQSHTSRSFDLKRPEYFVLPNDPYSIPVPVSTNSPTSNSQPLIMCPMANMIKLEHPERKDITTAASLKSNSCLLNSAHVQQESSVNSKKKTTQSSLVETEGVSSEKVRKTRFKKQNFEKNTTIKSKKFPADDIARVLPKQELKTSDSRSSPNPKLLNKQVDSESQISTREKPGNCSDSPCISLKYISSWLDSSLDITSSCSSKDSNFTVCEHKSPTSEEVPCITNSLPSLYGQTDYADQHSVKCYTCGEAEHPTSLCPKAANTFFFC